MRWRWDDAGRAAKSGEIPHLQRRVFDEIGRFVASLPSWQMGILDRYVPDELRPGLAHLTLFRDEFNILRDRYHQRYELVCKVIKIALAVQDTVIRSNSIGHASSLHDLRTGLVISDVDPDGSPWGAITPAAPHRGLRRDAAPRWV